jgi:TP901 family phage tail tape measure protein
MRNMLQVVERFEHATSPERASAIMQAAFGTAGSAAVAALATPAGIARAGQVDTALGTGKGPGVLPHLTDMQKALNETLQGRWDTLRTNMASIAALLATQLLPALTKLVDLLANVSGAILTFMTHHRTLTASSAATSSRLKIRYSVAAQGAVARVNPSARSISGP